LLPSLRYNKAVLKTRQHPDKTLVALLALFVIGGGFIFASAAFGFLARGVPGVTSAVFSHVVFGIGGGLVALLITYTVDYRIWRRYAPYLFGLAIFVTLLVFVPHLGMTHGGGQRWIQLPGISLQPSEALKVGIIIMGAAYFATIKARIKTYRWGMGGFLGILALPAAILVLQPDIGTLGVVTASFLAIYVAAGARARDILIIFLLGLTFICVLAITKPYIRDRITTFFHPAQGQQAEGYQLKQSLIAIGSGGLVGRGFGQGVQKFTYLPEAMGDSIFAVAGEELGFIGTTTIVLAFLFFALRSLSLAGKVPDTFGGLLAVGISTYFVSEAFINIGAMVGAAPLTGIPLTFISQGGSAMLISLASAGILLNVSRHRTSVRHSV
jgi:cell division protein FtsW